MKKSIFLSLNTLFLVFLFSCQSESPIGPNPVEQDVSSLEKPTVSIQIQTSVHDGVYYLNIFWNSIGGVKSYELSYTDLLGNKTVFHTYPVEHGIKNYEYVYATTNLEEGSYTIIVRALDGKGNEKSSAETSVDFPWLAVTGIQCGFEFGPGSTNVTASWDQYTGAYQYYVYLLNDYGGTIDSYITGLTTHAFNVANQDLGTEIKVRVDAVLSDYTVIGMGIATFTVPNE